MKIWEDINKFVGINPVVTIGIFDGVHSGHKYLIKELKKKAIELNGESVVVTLYPHPRLVLGQDNVDLKYLTTWDEKQILLQNEGVDHLVRIPFTKEFSELDSCTFVNEYLVKKLKIAHLLVGYNHRFGRDRQGDIKVLSQCASKYGFTVSKVAPLESIGEGISSSAIRDLIQMGNLEKANKFLGYNYFILGKVIEGHKMGRKIGFPTANIEINDSDKLLPKNGVYAVNLSFNGKIWPGMLNIGYRPTVDNKSTKKSIEVHLINFNADIYDIRVAMSFQARMRDEQKFESLEKLKEQLEKDRNLAIDILDKKS